MENIEAFKKEHSDLLLHHTYQEQMIFWTQYDCEITYTINQMQHYIDDVQHTREQKLDISVISHLTYNLSLQLSHCYNRAVEFNDATRLFLAGDLYHFVYDQLNDFQKLSSEIKTKINNLNEISLFEIYQTCPGDLFGNHYRDGLEIKNKKLLNLEKELACMNGVQLLKCLMFLLDLTENILIDIKNGIMYEPDDFLALVYDLNYVYFADNYWADEKEKFRNHIRKNELMDNVTIDGLTMCYRQIINDFKTNEVGRIWVEHSEDKGKLANQLKYHPINQDQWEYYFRTIFKLEDLKLWLVELRNPSKSTKSKSKGKQTGTLVKPRETMTFQKKSSVLDGHLTLLFDKLTKEGWIRGNEADFKALFSGKRDPDCEITWVGVYGKATLFMLFKAFSENGLIIVPSGFAISSIIEGHFKDKSGQWLSGLDKGNKPPTKAYTIIMECVKLLQVDPRRIAYGDFQEDDDFQAKFDPFDHQDLQMHKR